MTQIRNRLTNEVMLHGEMTIRELVINCVKTARANRLEADLRGADLRGADLRGADLRGADLRGADLSEANLSGADLGRANLHEANLRRANLCGATLRRANLHMSILCNSNLREANLGGADLRGTDLCRADISGTNGSLITIDSCGVFMGLYRHTAMAILATDGTPWVMLGCYTRTVAEWESDFWNNTDEFPDDGGTSSTLRLFAYQTCLNWFKLMKEDKDEH